ncbi:AbrB family transcriptional regulator [Roseicyclus marinus]|uniref:AbrB family transcriptional regulator n=1 Tax=Roseicyclus marinus TaxID=2161673 RepID=UPI00240FF2DD|nr:AbrB family transcriptional regulator [Roseicyclus marinus]MDG3040196.1 AbrB family transcriptional regulator [Roseicyclus marinus]
MRRLSLGPKAPRLVLTIAIGLVGTGLFHALTLPLPFLLGPLFACLVAALAGVPVRDAGVTGKVMRTILGVAIGASITPDLVARLPQMAITLAMVPLYVVTIAAIGVPFFRRFYGYDLPTAWYAAMPGGLADMTLFGQEAGANVRSLTLVHATRVIVIVMATPFLLVHLFDAALDNPIGAPASSLPPHELAIMVVAALLGWKGAERIGLFGAPIIGPMVLTAALSLADIIHVRPPAEAILAAQFFIGLGLGAGYVGITMAEVRRDVVAGLLFVVIVAGMAALFTEAIILFGLAPPLDGFLAFVPAGQAEMAILAIVVGADLGYVVLHHVARVFLIILGAPVAARLLGIRKRRTP